MPRLPTVCIRRETFFPSPIKIAPGSTNVTFGWNVVRQGCPRCGGSGRVLDGTFDFIGDAIRLVSGPEQTISDLERLAAILQAAQQRQREVAAQVPEMQALVNLLPKTRAEGFVFYIPILVLTIQLAVAALQKGETPKITVEQVNNQVINQNITINQNFTILPPTSAARCASPAAKTRATPEAEADGEGWKSWGKSFMSLRERKEVQELSLRQTVMK